MAIYLIRSVIEAILVFHGQTKSMKWLNRKRILPDRLLVPIEIDVAEHLDKAVVAAIFQINIPVRFVRVLGLKLIFFEAIRFP